MSFIDKLKLGMTEAGSKAKILVEVNKLRLINSGKNNEINTLYQEIGKLVVAASEQNEVVDSSQCQLLVEQIQILKHEIEQNKLQMNNLSDHKECANCSRPNPVDSRYCMKCGHVFKIYEINEESIQYIEHSEDKENKT